MQKAQTLLLLLLFLFTKNYAQDSLNMIKLAQWNIGDSFNDVWGYTDGSGNEYAILGSNTSIYFLRINPNNTFTLVNQFTPGANSTWRDFKTYQNYCYAVADVGAEGLLKYNLSNLPTSVSLHSQTTSEFQKAHNIFIDHATGRLYVVGSNTQNLIIYDITVDPPNHLASLNLPSGGYIHDIYVQNNTAYCSHGNNGFFIWDVSVPTSPSLLGSFTSEAGYNHSNWIDPVANYAYYAREVPTGLPMTVVDISDVTDISVVSNFNFPLLAPTHTDNVPHNPYLLGDFLYTSYYEDGVQVFDVSNPSNVTQYAYYDTYPTNTSYNGYAGCWGVYPFLSSGKILASDRTNGLLVLELTNPGPLLPIDLSEFTVQKRDNDIQINWITNSETNNDFFEIEKSRDGNTFFSIKKINAAGNSNEPIHYQTLDENPNSGNNYYRLKQTDFDGDFTYSKTEFVFWENHDFKIYPTLLTSNSSIQIELPESESSTIQLFDSHGEMLYLENLEKVSHHHINFPFLKNGIYFLKIKNRNFEKVVRLTVIR